MKSIKFDASNIRKSKSISRRPVAIQAESLVADSESASSVLRTAKAYPITQLTDPRSFDELATDAFPQAGAAGGDFGAPAPPL